MKMLSRLGLPAGAAALLAFAGAAQAQLIISAITRSKAGTPRASRSTARTRYRSSTSPIVTSRASSPTCR